MGNLERVKPPVLLNNSSNYSRLSDRNIGLAPDNLAHLLKGLGYDTLSIADPTVYSLVPGKAAAEKVGLSWLPGVRLPIQTTDLKTHEVLFLVRRNPGFQSMFDLASRVHRDKSEVSLNDFLKSGGNLIAILPTWFPEAEEWLAQDHVFFGATSPRPDQAAMASWVDKNQGKSVVAHDTSRKIPNPQELVLLYKDLETSLARTREIQEEVDITGPEIPLFRCRLVPAGEDSHDYLEKMVKSRAQLRPDYLKLLPRIQTELDLIGEKGLSDWMLFVYEVNEFANREGLNPHILTGSATHSLLFNLLRVNRVDATSLRHERFINPFKSGIPDADLHFADQHKSRIVDYIRKNYKEATLVSVVRHIIKDGESVPDTIARNASGVFLWGSAPQIRTRWHTLAQIESKHADKGLGIQSVDILTNRTLEMLAVLMENIQKALKGAGIEAKPNLNDPGTRDRLLNRAQTLGIPLVETAHARALIKRFGKDLDKLDLETAVAHLLGLMRPGAAFARRYYESYLKTKESPLNQVPEAVLILEKTNYTIIFENQLDQVIAELTDLGEAAGERFRKLSGDTNPSSIRREILNRAQPLLKDAGWDPKAIGNIIDQLRHFRGYAFSEGHARALAEPLITLAWYAEHYPQYFWSATLNMLAQRPMSFNYQIQAYLNEIRRNEKTLELVLPPGDRYKLDCSVEGSKIMLGHNIFRNPKTLDFNSNVYSEFLRVKEKGQKTKTVQFELDHFEFTTTNTPLVIFPPRAFMPEKPKTQDVIVEQVGRYFRQVTREEKKFVLASIDNGRELVTVAVPVEELKRVKKEENWNPLLTRFWHVQVTQTKTGQWEVVSFLGRPDHHS